MHAANTKGDQMKMKGMEDAMEISFQKTIQTCRKETQNKDMHGTNAKHGSIHQWGWTGDRGG